MLPFSVNLCLLQHTSAEDSQMRLHVYDFNLYATLRGFLELKGSISYQRKRIFIKIISLKSTLK